MRNGSIAQPDEIEVAEQDPKSIQTKDEKDKLKKPHQKPK